MTLPLEYKKWLLNERKLQQQKDDKMEKSLALKNIQLQLMLRKLAILVYQINMQD
jgi:hypothetical protein